MLILDMQIFQFYDYSFSFFFPWKWVISETSIGTKGQFISRGLIQDPAAHMCSYFLLLPNILLHEKHY